MYMKFINQNITYKAMGAVKEGKIVEVIAKDETHKQVLEQLISLDEGARQLGEVALVPFNSPLFNFIIIIIQFTLKTYLLLIMTVFYLHFPHILTVKPISPSWFIRTISSCSLRTAPLMQDTIPYLSTLLFS